MHKKIRIFSPLYAALLLGFLYLPMAVLLLFSFNSSNNLFEFKGFSLHWYAELLRNKAAQTALWHTIVLALSAATASVVIGTIAAVGMDRMRRKWLKSATLSVTNLPMMNPEIVTGISMMLLFVFAAQAFNTKGLFGLEPLGFHTMFLAHTTFCLPYVVLSVSPKLRQIDPHMVEAAQDLGCSPLRAFLRVMLPNIATGIASAFLLALTISLDDFVVSNFVSHSYQTLPIYIYSQTKKRVRPDMYALSTLIFAAIFLLLILSNVLQASAEKRRMPDKKQREKQ
ncbi:MAG: ABC transporter permease [Oscillospiraceae bacterium]|jgi:spermidine/putrescine transport system permease protein|nr:ABC transporter permease [Oscillospiraceae bacterium]